MIVLTSTVAAGDTANTGGNNNPNTQSRAETAQDFTTYAGCHTNAGKSYLGALIKDLDGKLRASLNLKTFSTRALTREFAKGGRVRYLRWFTAMSDDVGESQKQAAAEVNERLRKITTKKCSFVEIAEVPRILHWLRYSNRVRTESDLCRLPNTTTELTSQKEESTKRWPAMSCGWARIEEEWDG